MGTLIEPFTVATSDAGVTKDWCVNDMKGDETLQDLTPEDVARIYWMLEKVELLYTYTVQGITRSRYLILASKKKPLERIAWPPAFKTEGADGAIDYFSSLEVGNVARDKETGKLAMPLIVEEADEYENFVVTTERLEGYFLAAQKPFQAFDRKLTLYLWVYNKQWTGSIQNAELTEDYFEVKQ